MQFEVCEAAKVHIGVFYVVTPCNLVSVHRRFVVTPLMYRLFLCAHSMSVVPKIWHRMNNSEPRIIWYAPEWNAAYHNKSRISSSVLIVWIKHWTTFCREIQDTRVMLLWRNTYRKRASKGQTAESYVCVQILSCHICGCLKVFVHYRLILTEKCHRLTPENMREKHWDIL